MTSQSTSVPGRRCGSGTGCSAATALGTGSTPACWPRPTCPATWTGRSASTPRSTAPTSTRPHWHGTQGELANHTNLDVEPADHAIGRSRGGLSTKIHHACDGKGRPLVMLLGPGQGGDSPMFAHVLGAIHVPRLGPGRPRTRPDRVIADKAYSSRGTRALLRRRGIVAVIPEPSDQAGHRKHRGSQGVRRSATTSRPTAVATRSNVSFNLFKHWRGIATRSSYVKPEPENLPRRGRRRSVWVSVHGGSAPCRPRGRCSA